MVGQIQAATDVRAQIKSLLSQASVAMQAAPESNVAQTTDANGSATNQMPAAATPAQVVDTVTLAQFERARVTYQASSEPGRGYAYNATLTYERIAYAQTSAALGSSPAADSAAPPPADDQVPPAQDPQTPTSATTTTPDASGLHHVVINVTTVSYRQLTAHVVATPAAAVASSATPQTTSTVSTDSTAPAPQASDPTVKKLSVDDFAALRARTVDRSRESTLALKLTTQEGDLVELTFRQLDVLTQTRLKGVTDSGDRVRASDTTASSQRNVSMQITGDLSDAEKAAIDSVLQNVIDVANQFFHGDLQAAMEKMAGAQIDTGQLADVSLKMSMSQSREMNKATIGDDGQLQQLAHRDSGVSQALEFLADQQRTLIAAAKTRFDDHSAVKLVKQLLPALIAPIEPSGSTPADQAPAPATDTAPTVADTTVDA